MLSGFILPLSGKGLAACQNTCKNTTMYVATCYFSFFLGNAMDLGEYDHFSWSSTSVTLVNAREKNLDNNPNKVHMHKRKNAFAHMIFPLVLNTFAVGLVLISFLVFLAR